MRQVNQIVVAKLECQMFTQGRVPKNVNIFKNWFKKTIVVCRKRNEFHYINMKGI